MGRQPDMGKRRAWERRLRRFQKAGLSARQFCQGEGVSAAALAYWRRKLGRTVPCSRAKRSDAAFAAVEVVSAHAAAESGMVVIRFPRGASVELPADRLELLQAALVTLTAEPPAC